MEIDDRRVKEAHRFHDVCPGKCFYFGCDLYMVIAPSMTFGNCATNLKNGEIRSFDVDEEVEPVKAKVIVE